MNEPSFEEFKKRYGPNREPAYWTGGDVEEAIKYCATAYKAELETTKKYYQEQVANQFELLKKKQAELEAKDKEIERLNEINESVELCCKCGAQVQAVRPGKWQCVNCELIDDLKSQLLASESAREKAEKACDELTDMVLNHGHTNKCDIRRDDLDKPCSCGWNEKYDRFIKSPVNYWPSIGKKIPSILGDKYIRRDGPEVRALMRTLNELLARISVNFVTGAEEWEDLRESCDYAEKTIKSFNVEETP